jgi:hypothetical protein
MMKKILELVVFSQDLLLLFGSPYNHTASAIIRQLNK